MTALAGIVMGSDSDLPTMRMAAEICQRFAVEYEIRIVSAHRTPTDMAEYGRTAHQRGLRVIIAGAGGAAHLPGMLAAYTPLPVIGVPVPTEWLRGSIRCCPLSRCPPEFPSPPLPSAMPVMPVCWRYAYWPHRTPRSSSACSTTRPS